MMHVLVCFSKNVPYVKTIVTKQTSIAGMDLIFFITLIRHIGMRTIFRARLILTRFYASSEHIK